MRPDERVVRAVDNDELRTRDAFMEHLRALDASETRALAERLGEIAVPTAVIWGAHDSFLPVKLGKRIAAAIPSATLTVIPGARHFVPEDAPRPLTDAIAALLARQ